MIVIQYLAPSHLPMAAEGGWNSTKVTKKREIEKIKVIRSRFNIMAEA
jgi:hypothetical protein